MEVKFSKKVPYTPVYNNNRELEKKKQIKTFIQPLTMDDLLTLMDAIQTVEDKGAEGGIDKTTIMENMEGFKELVEQVGEFLPKYCEVNNLTSEDGEVFTVEDVIKYPYFLELASELLTEMATVSMPDEEEIKNSQTPPD